MSFARHYAPGEVFLTMEQVAARLDITPSGALKLLRRLDVEMVQPGRRLYVAESVLVSALQRSATGNTDARFKAYRKAS